MKQQIITLDINKLSTDQLYQISSILYEYNELKTCKIVNDRIAFLSDWMSEKQSEEYYKKYCED